MANCERCDGWGFERDPDSSTGWASDDNGNGIICRKEKGGCGGSGIKPGTSKEEAAPPAEPETLPEMRG